MDIDPDFNPLLADPRATVRRPPPQIEIAVIRAAADTWMRQVPPGPEMAEVEELQVGQVPIRRYQPTTGAGPATIVFIHGGGFVWGSIDTHDAMARTLAAESGAVVLSVGYRLAPEHGWHDAAEDCWTALNFAVESATGGISLAGDSAGAQLALASALKAGRQGLPLRSLGLLYPFLDPECGSESARRFADGPVLSLEGMRWFWDCASAKEAPPRLLDSNLKGLPPTSLIVGEADPLHDEGVLLAQRLNHAGVPVRLRSYAGMIHGFAGMPHLTPMAARALRQLAQDLA